MKVTVVMQNDYPLEVLSGDEESNRKYIIELGHKINEEYSKQSNPVVKYDRKKSYTKCVFVSGYEFEVKEMPDEF